MREILFRGKREDNGEWETGSLIIVRGGCSDEKVYIADKMTAYFTAVDPNTVGQYTGLTDKNGTKIFEGDIVYLAGTGNTEIEYPFTELFEAANENDIGDIIGNIYDKQEDKE